MLNNFPGRHSSAERIPTALLHQNDLGKDSLLISYGEAGKAQVTADQMVLTRLQFVPG